MAAYSLPGSRGNILPTRLSGINGLIFHMDTTREQNALSTFFTNLYDYEWGNNDKTVHAINSIVSLHYIPVKFGNENESTNVPVNVTALVIMGAEPTSGPIHFLYKRFKVFSECYITIPHPYNNYLDYPPYTRVVLHLPFIGDREIDHTPFLQQDGEYKGRMYIWWSVDAYTGDLTCFVCDHNKYVYNTFTGNCAIRFPVSGADYSQQVSGAMQAITGAITTVGGFVAENPMIAAAGLLNIGSGIIKAYQPPKTTINGSITGSHGYEGCWESYATVTRPKFDASWEAQGYAVKGKPCHKYVALNTLENTGFTKIAEIKMKNFPGQKSELDECLALLKEGVLL